ncbi:MAG: IS110 family transposase [Acidobacteria bacterium]|nr:IS110 family transposase [Acidobacteriota bacterium]
MGYPGHGLAAQAQALPELPAWMRQTVEALGIELASIEELRGEIEQAMIAESRQHPISRILRTTPGLGPIRVAQLIPIVITPHRFRTKRQFWAYCGFGLVTRTSSDWVKVGRRWVRVPVQQTRGLNQDCNRTLKRIFKGAAMTVIRFKMEPLWTDYVRLTKNGTRPNLARLTVARKLAAAVLTMWKKKERYNPKS